MQDECARPNWARAVPGLRIGLSDFGAQNDFQAWFLENYAAVADSSMPFQNADIFFNASLTFITRMHLLRNRGPYREQALRMMSMLNIWSPTFHDSMDAALTLIDDCE